MLIMNQGDLEWVPYLADCSGILMLLLPGPHVTWQGFQEAVLESDYLNVNIVLKGQDTSPSLTLAPSFWIITI